MTLATLTSEPDAERKPLSLRESWRSVLLQTEPGDYNDNLSLYFTALYAMKAGFPNEGVMIMRKVRKNIDDTGEGKSKEWLLPRLNCY